MQVKKTCSLSRFGYALAKPAEKRQLALRKSVRAYGSGYVIRKLVVLRTYRKSNPNLQKQYNTLTKDIAYVQAFRDAMSQSARQKDLKQYRRHQKLKNKNKVYC
jgi:hypothetical protein